MMSSPQFKRSLKGHFVAKPAEVRTSSNAGCLSEPLSSDVSVGLGKLGRVLERLVHLMSKTGAVEKTDQAEVGREGPPNLHYQRRFHDHRAKRRRKPGVKAPEEFALHRRQIWHLVTHPLLDAVVSLQETVPRNPIIGRTGKPRMTRKAPTLRSAD